MTQLFYGGNFNKNQKINLMVVKNKGHKLYSYFAKDCKKFKKVKYCNTMIKYNRNMSENICKRKHIDYFCHTIIQNEY